MANAKMTMDELLASSEEASKKVIAGDTVKGTVISVKKHEILIDLGAQGVGLVPRREASFVRNLNVGDPVTASVIEAEMDDGYVVRITKTDEKTGAQNVRTEFVSREAFEAGVRAGYLKKITNDGEHK